MVAQDSDEEDRASLGCSGAVVPIAQPQQLADAALALLADTATWNAASQSLHRPGGALLRRHHDVRPLPQGLCENAFAHSPLKVP